VQLPPPRPAATITPVSTASIWLVEDDRSIGAALLRTLVAEGYRAEWAVSMAEARALDGVPDLVVLDRGLPDGDGLVLCRELLERHPGLRVLVLTARTDEIDMVLGLDAGATDYVAKPFRLAELLARIRAQLRVATVHQPPLVIEVGDLELHPRSRRVHVGGEEVVLRSKEFDLLARLAAEPGSVVRRETLMSDVWDSHWFGGTKTLDVHVAALRRRIDPVGGPSRITTVRGVGYRLEAG
jgi:DNA-binding response OmpR family regulator